MGVRVTVDFDAAGVSQKASKIKTDRGLGLFLASEAASGMRQYVPARTETLANSAKTNEPFAVLYDVPYAKYPYEGKNMKIRQEVHPLATSKWDEAYESAHKGDLARAATAYIKRM